MARTWRDAEPRPQAATGGSCGRQEALRWRERVKTATAGDGGAAARRRQARPGGNALKAGRQGETANCTAGAGRAGRTDAPKTDGGARSMGGAATPPARRPRRRRGLVPGQGVQARQGPWTAAGGQTHGHDGATPARRSVAYASSPFAGPRLRVLVAAVLAAERLEDGAAAPASPPARRRRCWPSPMDLARAERDAA